MRVRRLHRELQARNITALPHVYLSEEFFNPEGMLGFAVPFYLASKNTAPPGLQTATISRMTCSGS